MQGDIIGQKAPKINQAPDSTEQFLSRMRQILNRYPPSAHKKIAEQLQHLALQNQHQPAASDVFYQAIRQYIQFAKSQDSMRTTNDSLKSESYAGPHWQRVRAMLHKFETTFPHSAHRQQIETWLGVIEHSSNKTPLKRCSELGVKPKIIPGKMHFVLSVSLPKKVQHMHMSGTIRFRVIINKKGGMDSYKLLSKPTHLGIEQAYEKAMKQSLHFKPITQDGKPVRASCKVIFPIKEH